MRLVAVLMLACLAACGPRDPREGEGDRDASTDTPDAHDVDDGGDVPDAGGVNDGGEHDAGNTPDAGRPDAGEPDAGHTSDGGCVENDGCAYGERCESGSCAADPRPNLCEACTIAPGASYCSEVGSFCLVDATTTTPAFFCGSDCSYRDCPSGYACTDVLVLTEDTCETDTDCGLRGSCNSDADCAGGKCDLLTGQCRPTCSKGAGDAVGFCGCLSDSDCPRDTCDGTTFRCAQWNQPCDPGAMDPCPPIRCQMDADGQGGVVGYCKVGQNCAPAEGLTCEDVRGP